MRVALTSIVLATAMLAAPVAQAANAIVTTNLNVRTGPGTNYPVIGAIPNGAGIDVLGCTTGYNWCQVDYGGRLGWASSNYLAFSQGSARNSNNFGTAAAAIGIPLIAAAILSSNKHGWHRPPPPRPPHWNNGPHRPGKPPATHRPGRPDRPQANRPGRPGGPGKPNEVRPGGPGGPGKPGHNQGRPPKKQPRN